MKASVQVIMAIVSVGLPYQPYLDCFEPKALDFLFKVGDEIAYLWPALWQTVEMGHDGQVRYTAIPDAPKVILSVGTIMQKEVQHAIHTNGMIIMAKQGYMYKVRFENIMDIRPQPFFVGADRNA